MKVPRRDHVDHVRDQWARQWPELDTFPVGVVARVGRLARYFDQGLDRVFSRYGLRREHWDALASLRRAGPPFRLSPTELYRGLMRSSGAMTNQLHRLEADGLIRRVPDPGDGRGLLVELTDQGRALVDEIAPAHVDNERAMLTALTPAEQRRFIVLLRKLLRSFEADQNPPPGAVGVPRRHQGAAKPTGSRPG